MRFWLFVSILTIWSSIASAGGTDKLFYLSEAPDGNIEPRYLPIGNGEIGAMVRGGTAKEVFSLNLDSLWTGDRQETGAYQHLGNLTVLFPGLGGVSSYIRTLDISKSIHTVEFDSDKGKQERTYFANYPDRVMVYSFKSSKPLDAEIILEDDLSLSAYVPTSKNTNDIKVVTKDNQGHENTKYKTRLKSKVVASGKKITMKGTLTNGMKYASQVAIVTDGGSVKAKGNTLKLKKVKSFVIFFTAESDYKMSLADNWKKTKSPIKIVASRIKNAEKKGFKTLMKRHIADYKKLYDRLYLKLGHYPEKYDKMPTDERLKAFKDLFTNQNKVEDTGLQTLIANYGRYLIISSSRPGCMPANLQGLWNWINSPAWRSDYHSNINVQMNYWMTEPSGLGECFLPFSDYIMAMRDIQLIKTPELVKHPNGEVAKRGWAVKTENGIFGGFSFVWNYPGAAWYGQHLWEHYAFTNDKKYLEKVAYPVLKETCQFWEDRLVKRDDGTLVVPKGWSPEHGPTEDGVTYDQEIVYDLFTNYIEASKELGVDKEYRKKIADMKKHLLKLKIGKWGQLQEWETDRDDPKDQHRHVSHLFGLHPGRQISPFINKKIFEAAKVSLIHRGDGGTGWSKAWKISFWARLHDGNHAAKLIAEQISHNYYPNLFDFHAPFQIDGNFGNTAGVLEMLIQSQVRKGKTSSNKNAPWFIELLPAIPDVWADGEAKGLRARGGLVVNMRWKNKKVTHAEIKGEPGQKFILSYNKKIKKLKIPKSGVFKLSR